MGIQLRAGRPFSAQDGARAPKVAIINETLARRFFPNENPIGHRFCSMAPIPMMTIVGVVGDTRHLGLDQDIYPEVYPTVPATSELRLGTLHLVVRVASGQNNPIRWLSSHAARAIRNQARAIDPNEPISQDRHDG